MTLHEPETASQAEKSASFWEWIFSNKLYRSTEFGGLHYITISDSKVEVFFWYLLFFSFSLLAGFHLYMSSEDLREETIETKIYSKVATAEHFKALKSWTLCKSGEFSSSEINSPNWDIQHIMAMDRKHGGNDRLIDDLLLALDTLYVFRFDDTLGTNLVSKLTEKYSNVNVSLTEDRKFNKSHYMLLRKYVQLQHRYSRSANTVYARSSTGVTLDFRINLTEPWHVTSPGAAWLKLFDHYDNYMNESSLLRQRLKYVQGCHRKILSWPNQFSNSSITDFYIQLYYYHQRNRNLTSGLSFKPFYKIYDFFPKHLRYCLISSVSYDFSGMERFSLTQCRKLNANFPIMLSSAIDPERFDRFDYEYDYEEGERMSPLELTQCIQQQEQMFLGEFLAMHVGDDKQIWFHGGNLTRSLEIVHRLTTEIDYRLQFDTRYRSLAQNVYYKLLTSFFDSVLIRDIDPHKSSLFYIDDELECYKLPPPYGIKLMPVETEMESSKSTLQHADWVRSSAVRFWITPDVSEPIMEPTHIVRLDGITTLTLSVARTAQLLNTAEQPCLKSNRETKFECAMRCNDEEIAAVGNCLSHLSSITQPTDTRNLPICRFSQMFQNEYLLSLTRAADLPYFFWEHNNINEQYTHRCARICDDQMAAPCNSTSFNVASKFRTQKEDLRYKYKDRFMNVKIKYEIPGYPFYQLVQSHKTNVLSWIATMGGVLEFWLGAGLLSLIHFVLYFVKMLVRHVNRRLRNRGALRSHATMMMGIMSAMPTGTGMNNGNTRNEDNDDTNPNGTAVE